MANPHEQALAADPEVTRTLGLERGQRGRRWVRWALWLTVVGLVAAGVAVVGKEFAREAVTRYDAEPVKRTDVVVTVTATGTVQPRNTVQVGSEVSGRVVAVHVDYNDRVERGQVLVELDREDFEARRREARATLAAARAALGQATATASEAQQAVRRTDSLFASGAMSEQQRDAARAAVARADALVESARAQITVAEAAVSAVESALAKTTIRSPIDGVVLSRNVELGQTLVATLQTPVLFVLAEDLAAMELHVDVDEADVGRVTAEQNASFTVDAFPDRTFQASVKSVRNAPRTLQNVVTYLAVLAVDNGDRSLRPGMTATTRITSDTRANVMAVPNAALRFVPPDQTEDLDKRRESRVYVLRGDEIERRVVRTGATDGRVTEIVSGGELREGDQVVVDARSVPPERPWER